MTDISGIWLPIITPFRDGAVDLVSYERLLEHYLARGVRGIFPLGTTGESPTLDDDEMEALVDRTVSVVAGRVPVFVGIGGNATAKVVKAIKRLDKHTISRLKTEAKAQKIVKDLHKATVGLAKIAGIELD